MEHIELLHIQQDEEADTDRPSVGEHGARDIPVKHGPVDRTEHEISPMILGKVKVRFVLQVFCLGLFY